MDPTFWHGRWRTGDIGFHQSEVNDLLVRHWPTLGVAPSADVFVPLAGKSLDMAWLRAQGHRVIASELSELAVDAFFSSQGLTPAESLTHPFTVKRAHGYELWVGDHFALPTGAIRNCAAAFDRAALIAMPRALQQAYADTLARLMPAGSRTLLVTIEYDPSEMSGPPFPVPAEQVRALFSGTFTAEVLERRDGLPRSENLKKRGLSHLAEVAYVLTRDARAA
ncbi:MAG: thiopurine S-methyltransferase [Hyphomicrobium sp.]